jgi:hypothetical protein
MELPIFKIYMNFSRHHLCCFIVVPLFLLDKSMAYNSYLQHPCFKNLCKTVEASENSDVHRPTLPFRICYHIHDVHSMLFALPGYQFPHTVMNRCLSLP